MVNRFKMLNLRNVVNDADLIKKQEKQYFKRNKV